MAGIYSSLFSTVIIIELLVSFSQQLCFYRTSQLVKGLISSSSSPNEVIKERIINFPPHTLILYIERWKQPATEVM